MTRNTFHRHIVILDGSECQPFHSFCLACFAIFCSAILLQSSNFVGDLKTSSHSSIKENWLGMEGRMAEKIHP